MSGETNWPGSFTLGSRRVGQGSSTFVIAEIGVNHEGDAALAAEMIHASAEAGADAVKLQSLVAAENYVPGTPSHAIFRQAELSLSETSELFTLARRLGIEPFTTCGDRDTLLAIDRLAPVAHKISSGLLTHLPLIRWAAETGRPLLLSVGMAEDDDIAAALRAAAEGGAQEVALLQCTSIYPAPLESLHLRAIARLGSEYGVPVGFSDHSLGITAAPATVAAGAVMIEKHVTLDSSRPGFDHHIGLEPEQLAAMVEAVRTVERMLGDPSRPLDPVEQENRRRYHRCLVARRNIPAGALLDETNVGIMRPLPGSRGLPPSRYDDVVGRRAAEALARFTPILDEHLRPPGAGGQ